MHKRSYGQIIVKRWHLIALCVIVSAAAAIILNYAVLTPRFNATAKIAIEVPGGEDAAMSYNQTDYVEIAKSITTVRRAMEKLKMPGGDAKKGYGGREAFLSNTIQFVTTEDNSRLVLKISTQGTNPSTCADRVNKYAEASAETIKDVEAVQDVEIKKIEERYDKATGISEELKAKLAKAGKGSADAARLAEEKRIADDLAAALSEQFKQASFGLRRSNISIEQSPVPVVPFSPDRKKNMMILVLLGLFAGIGIAFLLEEMEDGREAGEDDPNLRIAKKF